jgi:hypothetical protein
MELISKDLKKVDLSISLEELLILNNALNEVCHGLDQFEFDTRMGTSHEEVTTLLKKIGCMIDNFADHPTA